MKRLPAEWEKQHGVQLTWPHTNSDWKDNLDIAEKTFVSITKEIAEREKLLIVFNDLTPNSSPKRERNCEHIIELLNIRKVDIDNITFAQAPSNDIWARDHAAITIYEAQDGIEIPKLLKFSFNGWGNKYKFELDNKIHDELVNYGIFKNAQNSAIGTQYLDFVLEGGSIESDGKGTILTTKSCLLNKNRNPNLSKDQIEEKLKDFFGAKNILWLKNGHLAGDDTDSHIDTLARLCPNDTILYVSCDDEKDEHYDELKKMEEEIKNFRTTDGEEYTTFKLPLPHAKYDEDGNRMPATYANFLIINGAVLVPTYDDPNDHEALCIIQECFPDRKIIEIDCQSLIIQHGSLHCSTMQYPQGIKF